MKRPGSSDEVMVDVLSLSRMLAGSSGRAAARGRKRARTGYDG
jgi:hypothetical protein